MSMGPTADDQQGINKFKQNLIQLKTRISKVCEIQRKHILDTTETIGIAWALEWP